MTESAQGLGFHVGEGEHAGAAHSVNGPWFIGGFFIRFD
jgi:hypothetical protein